MEKTVPLKLLLAISGRPPVRVRERRCSCTAAPTARRRRWAHLTHNKVLHEKIVFLTVMTEEVPHVAVRQR